LDIFKPFDNKIKYGQLSQKGFIDLVETYNYIQGYFIQSIKTYTVNTKYYKVVEATNGVLVIWREITLNEDDSKSILEIVGKYSNIHTVEVNAHFATLQLDKNNNLKVGDNEVELHIIQKEIFNQ
jgi:adenine-specific DNA-methyltransferase